MKAPLGQNGESCADVVLGMTSCFLMGSMGLWSTRGLRFCKIRPLGEVRKANTEPLRVAVSWKWE